MIYLIVLVKKSKTVILMGKNVNQNLIINVVHYIYIKKMKKSFLIRIQKKI